MVRLPDREQPKSSHGPLTDMPVFGPNGGEIMNAVVEPENNIVHILEEDIEEPGTLSPSIISLEDFEALKQATKQLKPK